MTGAFDPNKATPASTDAARRRVRSALLAATAGVLVTFAACAWIRGREMVAERRSFEASAEQVSRALQLGTEWWWRERGAKVKAAARRRSSPASPSRFGSWASGARTVAVRE